MSAADLIVELGKAARALEDEGHYQAAKLFRAAIESEVARATVDRPRNSEDLIASIERIRRALAENQRTAALLGPMQQVVGVLRANVVRFEGDREPVWVCRYCGEVVRGMRAEVCPRCGTGALGSKEIPPVFYLEPLERAEVLAALTEFPGRIERLTEGLTEADAAAGAWPAREVVSHLLGAQRLLGGRALRTLDEDGPEFRVVPPTEVAEKSDAAPPRFTELLARFREARSALLERVGAANEEQLRRIGRHPQWGPMTLLQQISYIAKHEHSHLGDLLRAVGR